MDRIIPLRRFTSLVYMSGHRVDVARAALYVAKSEYPSLSIEHELFTFQRLAGEVSSKLIEDDDPLYCMNTLSEYLFDELEFKGNHENYYDPKNSYLNDVLKRRMGIPITLALVYMEVGRRLKIPLVGIGMPGHFLVRHRDVEDIYVDPFHGGILLSSDECRQLLDERAGGAFQWERTLLEPVSNREMLARIIRNLKAVYMDREDYVRALDIANFALALDPNSAHNRRDRGIAHYRLGHSAEALDDLAYYLDRVPNNWDSEGLHALVAELRAFLDD